MNQWKNKEDVIDWFKSIKKQPCKFVIFDIKDCHPSIKESLLRQSLDFEVNYIEVSNEDKAIIKQETNLYFSTNSGFDTTMGAYDDVEVSELVGAFKLYQLLRKYNKNNIS